MKPAQQILQVTVLTLWFLTCATGYSFYNPATGRWLSRDPIKEKGGLNVYCSVKNNLVSSIDILGLQSSPYSYAVGLPTGVWLLHLQDNIPVHDPLSDDTSYLTGFSSTYIPLPPPAFPACPCDPKNVVLVQAVHPYTFLGEQQPPHFDVYTDREHPYPHHDRNTPIPPVGSGLTFLDAPHITSNDNAPGNWIMEDCAVCRTRTGTSVSDLVIGCVKFTFKIDNEGKRSLSAQVGGTQQTGMSVYWAASELPGKTWSSALTRWQKPGNQM